MAREIMPFEDGVFTKERFKDAYNANLANGLGNLVSRIMKMAKDNIDRPVVVSDPEDFLKYLSFFDTYEINKATDYIWAEIGSMDLFIQNNQPFKLVKTDKTAGQKMISSLVVRLYSVARMLNPIMPETSSKIKELIIKNQTPETPLFIRKD